MRAGGSWGDGFGRPGVRMGFPRGGATAPPPAANPQASVPRPPVEALGLSVPDPKKGLARAARFGSTNWPMQLVRPQVEALALCVLMQMLLSISMGISKLEMRGLVPFFPHF